MNSDLPTREAKLRALRVLIDKQKELIRLLQRENHELKDKNAFQAQQLEVLQIRLEAYVLKKKYEDENSNPTPLPTILKPFEYGSIQTYWPMQEANLSEGTISLNYTADHRDANRGNSSQLLPTLQNDQQKSKTVSTLEIGCPTISNQAYLSFDGKDIVNHSELDQNMVYSTKATSECETRVGVVQ